MNAVQRGTIEPRRQRLRTLIEPLEQRVLLSVGLDLTLGVGGYKSITYPTVGGTTATIALNNGGSATVHFLGDSISQSVKNNTNTLSGSNIAITGVDATSTTKNSVFNVTTKGGTGTVSIGRITSNGSFKSIQGTAVALTNGVVVSGAVSQINVQRITGGPITLGTGVSTVIKVATNATFDLTAPGVKSITVGGNLTGSNITFLQATQGSMTDLATLSVRGLISGVTIDSRGSLGNLSATNMLNSTIFSGVGALGFGQLLPTSAADFTNVNKITSLKLKKTPGVVSFSDDYVSAHNLGTIALGGVLLSNGGIPFGLSATKYNSLNFVAGASGKTLQLNNVTSSSQVSNAVSKAGVNLQDFEVLVAS
jgi:hypothetical protein